MDEVVVTASELARNTSSLLDEVDRGRTVIIQRRGRPVARLVPNPVSGISVLGCMAGSGRQLVDDRALMAPLPNWETA
jgi:prevent-host-death family protein